jgi:hypothetical protein
MHTNFWLQNLKRRKRPLGRHRHRWGITSRWSLRKQDGRVLTGFVWLKIGSVGFCEQAIEPSCSIKWRETVSFSRMTLLHKVSE